MQKLQKKYGGETLPAEQTRVSQIKEEEKQSSARRMDKLQEQERHRQIALGQRRQVQRRQDIRSLMTAVVVTLAIILLLVVLLTLL